MTELRTATPGPGGASDPEGGPRSSAPAGDGSRRGSGARARSFWETLAVTQARFPVAQVALLFVTFAVGAIAIEGFGSYNSVRNMLVLAALVGLTAVGQTLVVLVGGLDLSVSGFIVAGALTVTQLAEMYGWNFGTALLVAIVGAGLLGAFTGWLCNTLNIQPLIVTLAMSAIAVGVVQVQTGGAQSGSAPAWLSQLSAPVATTFGIPMPPVVFLWLLVGVLMWLFLSRTRTGRQIYATGTNPRAADLALIRTRRIWTGVFAFSAISAVLAGVILAGFAGSVDGSLGGPYLFQSLAAVIVGGTVFGGPGDYWRTMIGAILLVFLGTVILGLGFTIPDRQVMYGAIILLAMAAYGREKKLSSRI